MILTSDEIKKAIEESFPGNRLRLKDIDQGWKTYEEWREVSITVMSLFVGLQGIQEVLRGMAWTWNLALCAEIEGLWEIEGEKYCLDPKRKLEKQLLRKFRFPHIPRFLCSGTMVGRHRI